MALLRLFADNLLPVFLATGIGYLLAARTGTGARSLSRAGFSVFAPCLVTRLIVENHVSGPSFLRMAGFTIVVLGSVAAIAWFLARRLGLSRSLASAVALVVLIPNSGNFGLSANLFAFGDAGLAQATLYFVSASIISYTIGVFIASAGRAGMRASLRRLITVPTIWAVAAAFLLVASGVSLPFPIQRTVWLLADATIPTFLMVLGIQLHATERRGPGRALALAAAMRLGGGLVAALLASRAFGLAGPARQAAVFQSAMPSAVICTILATEYDLEPAFVTRAVFVTTLLSPLTLTPLIAFLQR